VVRQGKAHRLFAEPSRDTMANPIITLTTDFGLDRATWWRVRL